MILQYALVPWSSPEDHCGQIMGAQTLPNLHVIFFLRRSRFGLDFFRSHGIGVFLLTWPFSTGVTVAVLRPTMPATPYVPIHSIHAIYNIIYAERHRKTLCKISTVSMQCFSFELWFSRAAIIATRPDIVLASPAFIEVLRHFRIYDVLS